LRHNWNWPPLAEHCWPNLGRTLTRAPRSWWGGTSSATVALLTARGEQCNGCTFGYRGWAPRPLVIKVGTVPTGKRSEHCVHWRPRVGSGTRPFLAAGLGCQPDRLLMAWDECHGAVSRREDCVTVTHLSAGLASHPSAIRVGTVPTGSRGEHCVHWRPGVESGTMDAIPGGWSGRST